MNREDKIYKIYEVIADKTLSFGCKYKDIYWRIKCYVNKAWYEKIRYLTIKDENSHQNLIGESTEGHIEKIIWHPVMIWDVLDWIDLNSNREDVWDWHKSRKLETHRKLVVAVYNYFIWWYRKPIEAQNQDCIDFIYWLIEDAS